jgi:hypothetical protein
MSSGGTAHSSVTRLESGASASHGFEFCSWYALRTGRCVANAFKGMSGAPTSRSKRFSVAEHGMAYGSRGLGSRNCRSSQRQGKLATWRRAAGKRHFKRRRVREAHLPEPSGMSFTGELIDTEKVTISSEGRRWRSACKSNSLASYPTHVRVCAGGAG